MASHAPSPPEPTARVQAAGLQPVEPQPARARLAVGPLVLGALGVVYGDIGTSPLYTMKTALDAGGGATPQVALGILSLIVWTLIITTSIKYVALVMRADNEGEGGILALMALISSKGQNRRSFVALGILGAALLYGDGAITPAISVLSALEGIKVPVPAFTPFILPCTVVILIVLFALQQKGTAVIGRLFGPVMTVWFVVIGALGLASIVHYPAVLAALSPVVGVRYLATHGFVGFTMLGAVFLCATGAEALYADMGHFGARPIRLGWYGLVLPSLVLNYAGMTALIVGGKMPADANPFFMLAPAWAQIPMVCLATVATIIASQAIISGVFSMTRQAIQLNLFPRVSVVQTSEEGYGQIYVPSVNWLLMVFTLGLAISFKSSDNLAAAYGIAVSLTMLLTTVLMYRMMRDRWQWRRLSAMPIIGLLGVVDASFVCANLTKVLQGGWVPLAAALVICLIMIAWSTGRTTLLLRLEHEAYPLTDFIASTARKMRVQGTAVYLTRRTDIVPLALLHSLKHYKVLHERNIILHVETDHVPRVPLADRAQVKTMGDRFFCINLRYGFMEQPDIPLALHHCADLCAAFNMMDTTFFVSRETIGGARSGGLNVVFRSIFAWLHRNASDATAFFKIPRNRLVELGARIEL